MVAGKVKAAMGLRRSSTTGKPEKHPSCPPTLESASPLPRLASTNAKAAAFARSFGVYFPRVSPEVQPRPPDAVTDLLRLVAELREKESRLQTQLLEQKILRETVAVVPALESEISSKNDDLNRSRETIQQLEAENEALKREIGELRSKIRSEDEEGRRKDEKIKEMGAELEELRRRALFVEIEECSSSQRFQGLIDASARSNLLKNLRKGSKSTDTAPNQEATKATSSGLKALEGEPQHPLSLYCTREEFLKPRAPRIPIPPPAPSFSSNSSSLSSASSHLSPNLAAFPRIPPLPSLADGQATGSAVRVSTLPPPPPPPPEKGRRFSAASVRRVPEVVEFYHSLMRRESRRESAGGGAPEPPPAAANNARDMIGEIENRSAYLLAIKTDVETQGDFIRFLIKEVENAAFTNIEDVVAFVKWLDEELSFLVDERAVLKHFEWPEHKADAMREAAFGYCDLKKLESEAASFRDDPRQPYPSALKKMQALVEKLEQGVYNLSRVRESARKRCEGSRIPWEWMLDYGIISEIKLASVKLAMKYMKRVSSELEALAGGPEEEELMLQGVRFAFRVHQFAGGFDADTMRAFQELKDKAHSLQIQSQSQPHQHKLSCRSTT